MMTGAIFSALCHQSHQSLTVIDHTNHSQQSITFARNACLHFGVANRIDSTAACVCLSPCPCLGCPVSFSVQLPARLHLLHAFPQLHAVPQGLPGSQSFPLKILRLANSADWPVDGCVRPIVVCGRVLTAYGSCSFCSWDLPGNCSGTHLTVPEMD